MNDPIALHEGPSTWCELLKPRGEGEGCKEEFGPWWSRNEKYLSNLDPLVAEQWIYRHWTGTPYRCIPLSPLTCKRERWSTDKILSKVGNQRKKYWDVQFDYTQLNSHSNEPARSMNETGTWNYPIVILKTPNGVQSNEGVFRNVFYWLIEGHQRMRYLNAAQHFRALNSEHEVFVLDLKISD